MAQDIDKDDIEEEWRDIDIYPQYQISNIGNVVRKKDGLLLKQYPQKSGYVYVVLDRGEGRHYVPIHRLVCIAFHGMDGYVKGLYVDHINTIRSDNRACNLRWVTAKENANNETTKLNRKRKRKAMKPNELLDGIYVYFNCFDGSKITVKVTGFKDGVVYGVSEYGTHWCQISKVEPIPLTQENLEKNEFRIKEEYDEIYDIHNYYATLNCVDSEKRNVEVNYSTFDNKITIFCHDRQNVLLYRSLETQINYVHQLQHAFRIFGIEKEIVL